VTTGIQIAAMEIGPGAGYGHDLFAAVEGGVLRINPYTSRVSVFASGLGIGPARPTGLAFDRDAALGSVQLYVCQANGDVLAISTSGVPALFASGSLLAGASDIAIPPVGSVYGAALFVATAGGQGRIVRVFSGGAASPFGPPFAVDLYGLAFRAPSSAWRGGLYALEVAGALHSVDAAGAATAVVPGQPGWIDFAFARSDFFGDFAYVADAIRQRVLVIAPSLPPLPWAQSFQFGGDGELAFDAFGDELFVAHGPDLIAIRPCAGGSGQVNSPLASLHANGAGEPPCRGYFATVNRQDALHLVWQGPAGAPCMLFAAPTSSALQLFCTGRLEVGTPPYQDLLAIPMGALSAVGRAEHAVDVRGLPPGALFWLQGVVAQTTGCPLLLTASCAVWVP
jgi:hypothetical protein